MYPVAVQGMILDLDGLLWVHLGGNHRSRKEYWSDVTNSEKVSVVRIVD